MAEPPARLTAAESTPSCRSRMRSILTAHVAQVMPSTSKRRLSARGAVDSSAEDCVALLLDGVFDPLDLDLAVVVVDGDSRVGNCHLYRRDTAQ